MCVVSMVHDYYQPIIPREWTWPHVQPFTPTPMPRQPLDPEALRKLLDDFRKAVDAAKKVDALTGQPDCVDPEKATLEKRVADLEKQLAAPKKPEKKRRTKKQDHILTDADKPITGTWRTKAGVRVVSRGTVQIREGKEKLACYKERTGGFHGWLRVSQLTKVRGVKPGKASA